MDQFLYKILILKNGMIEIERQMGINILTILTYLQYVLYFFLFSLIFNSFIYLKIQEYKIALWRMNSN